MNINKKNFYIAALFGLLIGSAFTISAFTEPTTLPADTSSYPPINLSPVTQYHYGSLCFGDGTNKVDTSQCPVGSLTIKSNLLLDRLTVRQNANFVSDVTVDKRNIFAGALRVAQVSVDADPAKAQSYTTGAEKLYFPNGTTTNLISGDYCRTSNDGCQPGTVFYKKDSSYTYCRYINPVKSAGNLGSCADWNASVSIVLTNTTSAGTCLSSRNYTASGNFSNTIGGGVMGTFYWYVKGINDADWTYLGTGTTKSVVVVRGSSSTKVYEIVARGNGTMSNDSKKEDVYTVVDTACSGQQGGTTGGSTGW